MTAYQQIVSMLQQVGIIDGDRLMENQLNSVLMLLRQWLTKEGPI